MKLRGDHRSCNRNLSHCNFEALKIFSPGRSHDYCSCSGLKFAIALIAITTAMINYKCQLHFRLNNGLAAIKCSFLIKCWSIHQCASW